MFLDLMSAVKVEIKFFSELLGHSATVILRTFISSAIAAITVPFAYRAEYGTQPIGGVGAWNEPDRKGCDKGL